MRYLHPERTAIHLLNKPISFDDVQEAVYRHPPPLIVVGSAGSGKTALMQADANGVRDRLPIVARAVSAGFRAIQPAFRPPLARASGRASATT